MTEVNRETGYHHKAALRVPAGSMWDRLASCESSGRWHIVDPPYTGGLQFTASTWRSFGGAAFAPSANLATRAEQITVAIRVQHVQGWGAWPVCSIKEGIA